MTAPATTAAAAKGFGLMLHKARVSIDAHRVGNITVDKIVAGANLVAATNPAIYECSPKSVLVAVYQAARLGLELGGPLGHCYIVPYKRKATLIVGYKGLIELVHRGGKVKSIIGRVVREGDCFEVVQGTDETIKHIPASTTNVDRPILTLFAVAKLVGGGSLFDWMTKAEVDAIRARSAAADSGPWVDDYPQMARKTVIRRLCNVLPMTPELAAALELVDREAGQAATRTPILDDEIIVDGDYEVVEAGG